MGRGKADFEIAFPELQPFKERSPVTVYNGGLSNGVRKLYVNALIATPVPAEIVSTVEIERVHRGRYGSQAMVKIPVIAGGHGSLLDFDLHLKRLFEFGGVRRSVVAAKCSDGQLDVKADSLLFENEADTPGVAPTTLMKGSFVVPCQPER